MYFYTILFAQFIVFLLNYHTFKLRNQALHIRLFVHSNINDDNNIRRKIGFHNINREIVINTAIKHWNTIFINRFKRYWKAHRHSNSFTQVATRKHYFLFVIYVGCYTTKRHKQFVEIALTKSCMGRKHFNKANIHRERINKT